MKKVNRSRPAIYSITHIESGRVYVGSAVNLRRRWELHRRHLRKQIHANKYLQRAFDKYGAGAFCWEVLEWVDDLSRLYDREQWWMDTKHAASRAHGFNLHPTAGGPLGFKHSAEFGAACAARRRGCKHSEETKAKMSAAKKGNKNGAGTIIGKIPSDTIIAILDRCAAGHLHTEIAASFGITVHTVGRIAKRQTYRHVQVPQSTLDAIAANHYNNRRKKRD